MKKIFFIISAIIAAVVADQLIKGLFLGAVAGTVPMFGNACDLTPMFCDNGGIVHGADFANLPMTDWFKFVFVWNPGVAFSFFRGIDPMFLTLGTGAVIAFLLYLLFTRTWRLIERVALALIIGGALGNLTDRIRFGAVIDFLDFHIKNWHWPAFNFADICISVGVGLFVIAWLFGNKKDK